MAGGTSRRGIISEINVTPLVDVVLVLLIIFMVVTEVIHETERPEVIEMNLPTAASGEAASAEQPFTLSIAADGKLSVNGESVEREDVEERLKRAIEERGKDLEVMVAADAEAPHKRFVSLLDLLRNNGVTRISIETLPAEAAPPTESK